MTSKPALPMLALALSACASKPRPAAADRGAGRAAPCPAYPLPPAELVKPPVKTDFLTPTG